MNTENLKGVIFSGLVKSDSAILIRHHNSAILTGCLFFSGVDIHTNPILLTQYYIIFYLIDNFTLRNV
jgi:hypothetical protein